MAMSDGLGSTTWAYDDLGRPITITQPFTGSVIYGYDSAGNRTSLKYPDGKVVTYTYDLALRLVQVQDWQALATQYAYNAAGQVLTTTLPNAVTTTYTYDPAERLIGLSHQTLTQTLRVYTYTVDAVGNRTQAQESTPRSSVAATGRSSIASGSVSTNGTRGSVTAFTGGTAGLAFTRGGGPSIPMLETITYTYDAVGNRLTETTITNTTVYTYDIANRLVNVGGVAQTWDNNGNLLNDGVFTYTYDSANRLTSAVQGANTYTFGYTGLGDRMRQVANGITTTYTLDLNAGLMQVLADVANGATNTYLYGNGRIAQQSATSTDYFLGDALGSVRQLADASSAVTLARSFEPYGSVLNSAGTGSSIFDFTGEQRDAGTGLIFLRARFYSSYLNQWIQPDPIGPQFEDPRTLNHYVYVNDNPINLTDPSGQTPCSMLPWEDCPSNSGPLTVGANELRVIYLRGVNSSSLERDDCRELNYTPPVRRTVTVQISPKLGVVNYTYNKTAATRPVKTYTDIRNTGDESIAIRTLLAEVGNRLVTKIHGVQEGVGILLTGQNRAASYPQIWKCSTLGSCLASGTQYAVTQSPIARDPLCVDSNSKDFCKSWYGGVSDKEEQLKVIDLAAIAYMLVKQNLIADFTQGADSFVHRCGGTEYGQTTDHCSNKGDPNTHIGPLVFYECNLVHCDKTQSGIKAQVDCEQRVRNTIKHCVP